MANVIYNIEGYAKRIKYLNYKKMLIIALIIVMLLLAFFYGIFWKKNKNIQETSAEIQNTEEEPIVITLDSNEEDDLENIAGIIYLTFDDGPSNSTPQILDILEKNNIKATFFVIHYSEENEKYIKQEKRLGNTIALHGYTHVYSEVYSSADSCIENFRKIQEQVKQTTGYTSNIIRFPGGSSNKVSQKYCEGVMTELTQRVIAEGFRYFDWNVDSDDAGSAKSSDDVYNNVISGISKHKKSVVLMHDFSNNNKTIEALQRIIDYGKENGYVFRKITDKTEMVTHKVNN